MINNRTKAMAALFCAIVTAQKSRESLADVLRILPVSREAKSMVLRSVQPFSDDSSE